MLRQRRKKRKTEHENDSLEYQQKLKSLILELRAIYEKTAGTKINKGILEITKTTKNILQCLIDDNSKTAKLRLFIDYYLPELVQIINQYIAIKSNNISSEQAAGIVGQIEDFIPVTEKAFGRILENITIQDNSDVEIDIKIMIENLKKKRLL